MVPGSWRTTLRDSAATRGVDATVKLSAPDGTSSTVLLEFKTELTPSTAESAWRALRSIGSLGILVAPLISKRTQKFMRDREIAYFDLAGNAYWRLDSPALFVSVSTGDQVPTRHSRGRRLGGKKAGRLIRYICEKTPPFSVGELASSLSIDAGNVSRYLGLLRSDGLVERGARGVVTSVDWEGTLRRWSDDYRPPTRRRYQDPRGQEHFFKRLRSASERYVISGVTAATRYAPYTVDDATLCYCDDVAAFAGSFGLRRSEQGGNVLLALPFDEVVYDRTQTRDGLIIAAPLQVAVDLLVGRGRELSQAEELIKWMKAKERDWRF